MTETHSTSQNSNSQNSDKQNLEKIAALARIFENREHALQEIQKQLQTITGFMQKVAETKENGNRFQIQVLELFLSTIMGKIQSLQPLILSRT